MPLRTLLGLLLALAVTLPACATSGGSGGTPRDRNLLTSEELREAGAVSQTLDQAIRRLRPRWLRPRSSSFSSGPAEVVVYMDGSRLGGPATLAGIPTSEVGEVRYLAPPDATTRYGTGHAGGVIQVRTRRR